MNLSTINTGLAALFGTLSGLPNCHPDNQSGAFWDDAHQAILRFRVEAIGGVGRDELRRTYDPNAVIAGDTSGPGGTPATGGVVYTATGLRELRCSVLVECGRQDLTASLFLERVRTGLRLPSSKRALAALELGLQKIGQSQDVSYDQDDNREVSASVFDITFNAADYVDDAPVTTIKTVQFTVNPT